MTDGEFHEEAARVQRRVEELADSGLRVYTVGVGSEAGVPLMRRDYRGRVAGPLTGPGGEPVVSRLNRTFLERLAAAGGGEFLPAGADDDPVAAFLDQVDREAPDSRTARGDGSRDIPYRPGILALALLLIESGGESVERRAGEKKKGGRGR